MKKIVRTVNKHKPQIEFSLWHSNDKGYCPVGNREQIGICNTRDIVKKILNLKNNQIEMVLDKIQDEGKFLVFGENIDAFFEDKIRKYPNVFFLGVINE
jgi:hypothetical protein